MSVKEREIDYGSNDEFAYQTIEGLRCNETVFLFSDEQLEAVKRKTSVPFHYYPTGENGYVLFPSKCDVVDEEDNVVLTDTYLKARRYMKKQSGVKKLFLKLHEKDVEHVGFKEENNIE